MKAWHTLSCRLLFFIYNFFGISGNVVGKCTCKFQTLFDYVTFFVINSPVHLIKYNNKSLDQTWRSVCERHTHKTNPITAEECRWVLICFICGQRRSDRLFCRMQSVQTRERVALMFLCLFVFRYTGAQVREQLVVLGVVYSLSCNELF